MSSPRSAPVLTRRIVLSAAGAAALLGLDGVSVWAQSASPIASPAALDLSAYPEVTVTNTDDAVTLSTDTVPAGYVLLTVKNQMTPSDNGGGGSSVIGPPAGTSLDDFVATVQQQLATPVAG